MVKKFFLFISFVLISNAILAQDDGYLELLGTIMQEGKVLEGVDITILKGSEKIDNPLIIVAKGNFMVNLPFGFDYNVVVSKNGFSTKSFLVNTKVPDSEKKQIFSFKIKLDLIKNSENNNQINKANQPIAKLAYNNDYADFDYDANFVKGKDAQSTETPKVSNIVAEQVGQTIQVSYNLETESPFAISLFYSTDNGASWQGPLKKVSGDVGEKIYSGNKKIIWDVLNEMEQFKFSSVVFKIDARKTSLKEVKIGSQIWSAENLDVERYSNGDIIPQVKDATSWSSLTTGAWCYYNNDSTNGPVYGKLYNWYAVADPNGLCPTGWHVPSDREWTTLETYLGGSNVAGGKMKETGLTHWASPNTGATNSSGFTGLPGGDRDNSGTYSGVGSFGDWWSATQGSAASAYYRNLNYLTSSVYRANYAKGYGFSVRCVRD